MIQVLSGHCTVIENIMNPNSKQILITTNIMQSYSSIDSGSDCRGTNLSKGSHTALPKHFQLLLWGNPRPVKTLNQS